MHAKEIRELVRRKHREGLSYSKISHQLKLSKSTVHDMIKNDYKKTKKANGTKNIWIQTAEIQATNCSTQAKESQINIIKNQERGQPGG